MENKEITIEEAGQGERERGSYETMQEAN